MEVDIPKEFICPITLECMEDPYTDNQGISYDKIAILEWLRDNNISPSTRKILYERDLTPNLALKSLINDWKKKNNYQKKINKKISIKGEIKEIESNYTYNNNNNTISISVKTEDFVDQELLPVDWIFSVDTSGSMGSPAIPKGEEDSGFSILDLVKHALKSQIYNMTSKDTVTLFTYSSSASLCFSKKEMDQQGKQELLSSIDKLYPSGGTNIWDGIFKPLECIDESYNNPYILLFTDGQPTVSPPRGEQYYLEKYIDKNGLKAPINTYGFGKNLNEELLYSLSLSGKGRYNYIPDIGFVGTIFVNSQANIMSNIISNLKIKIEYENMCEEMILGSYEKQITSWGCEIYLGNLQYGQEKTIVLKLQDSEKINSECISISYVDMRNNQNYDIISYEMNNEERIDNNIINYNRLFMIENIKKCIQMKNNNVQNDIDNILEETVNILTTYLDISRHKNYIQDLIKDVSLEMRKALSPEYYNTWGKKYLLSILTAHLNQECNNFKDPGVQHYGLPLFNIIRDKADEIFIQLPPPKPSRIVYHSTNTNGTRPLRDMSSFNNSSGPCFAPWCKVEMNNNTFKRVDEIKKGDIIKSIDQSGNIDYSKVLCVVETEIENARCHMSNINNLVITPWHPIRIKGKWQFPENIQKSEEIDCEKIYSFLIDKNHIMYIQDVECITLAHGIQDNDVTSHPYFATNEILKDLKKMYGFEEGKITLKPNPLIRNSNNGLVIKMKQY